MPTAISDSCGDLQCAGPAAWRPPCRLRMRSSAAGRAQRGRAGRRRDRASSLRMNRQIWRSGCGSLPPRPCVQQAWRCTRSHSAAASWPASWPQRRADQAALSPQGPGRLRSPRPPRGPPARADQHSRCPWCQTAAASRHRSRPLPGSPGTAAWPASLPGAGGKPAAMAAARQSDLARSRSMSSRDPTGHGRSTAAAGAPDSCGTPVQRVRGNDQADLFPVPQPGMDTSASRQAWVPGNARTSSPASGIA
jgi:hypothetical protein